MRIFAGNAREIRKSEKKTSDNFRLRAKKAPAMQALEKLSKKSVFAILPLPRVSAHKIIFAKQIIKTGGVYLGFYTLRGRKFPHGNFRTSVFCEVRTHLSAKL